MKDRLSSSLSDYLSIPPDTQDATECTTIGYPATQATFPRYDDSFDRLNKDRICGEFYV